MNKNRVGLVSRAMRWLCCLSTVGLFALCWHFSFAERFDKRVFSSAGLLLCLIYALATLFLFWTYGAFDIGKIRVSEVVYSLTLSNLVVAVFFYLLIIVMEWVAVSPLPLLALVIVQFLFNVGWSILANAIYFKLHNPRTTIVIYRSEQDLNRLNEIKFFTARWDIRKYLKDPATEEELLKELEGFEAVFVAGIHPKLRSIVSQYCVMHDVQGYVLPEINELIMSGARHMQMLSVPVMRISRARPGFEYLAVKRMMDICCSLLALIVTSPIMLLTAAAIKLYDGGPVFYKQVRLTQNGREFKILKFRSMNINAEQDGVARLASQGDERITPVGRIIRSCRIDELPQLINILTGEMTIVGPRPERPEIAAEYEQVMPAFALRLQVKAGLTGLAQVYGRYNTDPMAKLQMDLMYINRMCFAEDVKLIFATVKILFMKVSTEGIQDDQRTAISNEESGKGAA